MLEWQLIFLDENGRHMDSDYYETLIVAMSKAEANGWASSFEIHGMGQSLKGVYENSELKWLGIKK